MIIGIDQSMKSTAVVALNLKGEMVDFGLIIPPSSLNKEETIHYIWEPLYFTIGKNYGVIKGIAIEGLAFSAFGNTKDLLYGIQWYVRTRLKVEFPEILVGVINVQTWRSCILTREEQRLYKTKYGKIGLKIGVVEKLPNEIKMQFDKYLELNKDEINACRVKDWKPGCKSKKYLESMYDLADAWGIATHRLKLYNTTHKINETVSSTLKFNRR